jgi:endonuclease/exonuclease/phosphatase (EEP) superfamily protein YafD
MIRARGAARRSGPLRGLLAATAIGVTAASVLAVFGRSFWLFELASHFRLQWLTVQLLLLVVLLSWRHWTLVALTLPLTIVNAAALADYWPRPGGDLGPGAVVELWSANLYARNTDHGRFIARVREAQPALLVLQEVDTRWADALMPLAAVYPHQMVVARDGPFGIAVLSRVPLLAPTVVDLRGAPAIDTGVMLSDGREFRLVAVHLRPPSSAALAAERNRQLDELAALLQGDIRPRMVVGDFNSTPYSPLLADWLGQTGLRDSRRGRGPGMSWPTYFPPLGIPIDHCMLSDDVDVIGVRRGPAFGSDHFPLEVRLSLRGGQPVL